MAGAWQETGVGAVTTTFRAAYAVGLAALVPALAVALLVWNGAISPAAALGLPDPGALTRWGLPLSRGVRDLSAAMTIGALVLTAVAIPPESVVNARLATGTRARALGTAALFGFLWTWSSLAVLVFTYSDLSGISPLASGGLEQLNYFVTDFDLGRSLLASSTLAAVVSLGSLFARRISTVGVLALVAVAALWPLALTGHAAGALNHDIAVNAQAGHLLGVTVWVGGLAVLVLYSARLGDHLPAVASRYSRLAGWCFAIVAVSGVAAAILRVGEWDGLGSSYAALLAVKTVALLLVGAAGWWHRRRLLPGLVANGGRRAAFARLAGVELVIMAVAMGTGVALGRTPPPADGEAATAAETLLGFSMPPPLGAAEWITQWRIDTLWTPLALVGIGWYLYAARRLRQRGDRWPLGRTIAWIIGSVGLIWSTSGSPGVYGDVLFSMHMVQHMTIATAVPAFLVLGAPMTLALRTLPVRRDGSRGAREWLLLLVHSRFMRLVGHPLVAGALFIGSVVVFYYSPVFELSLRSHTAHVLMVAHFLITGYLFASVICGIDPGVQRPAYPLRTLLLMVIFGIHAFFSISLMANSTILAGDWFSALNRRWGRSLEDDQYLGASIGWALGDYPLAILAGALIWSWVKTDHREATRHDRKAARDGERELSEYNDYLRRLQEHERR